MIDTIYEEIRAVLLGLKLKEAKEYFDNDNVPDSLSDNTFTIGAVELAEGNSIKTAENIKVAGLIATFKINLAMRLPANNIINKMKLTGVKVEDIIKGIVGITVGEDEKDIITFIDAPSNVEGDKLTYEINFGISYRINNI
jgi:hypothetical protein